MKMLDYYEKRIIRDEEFPVDLFMNQIRRQGEYFSAHWHEHIELHYIQKGTSRFTCGQQKNEASAGDVVIINSNEMHAGACVGQSMESIVIIFELDAFSRELVHQNVLFQTLIPQDEWLNHLFSSIYRENEAKETGYKLACKGMLYELIAYLVRRYAVGSLSEQESLKRKQNLERLNTVLQYISLHYDEPVSVPLLAEMMHVSEGRFGHLFKDSMGVSPLQYINQIRLKKAVHLMQKKDCSISQAAMEAGFSDINHFGRQFKRYYGKTPSELLKNSRIV